MAPTPMSDTTLDAQFLAAGCLQFLNSGTLSLEKLQMLLDDVACTWVMYDSSMWRKADCNNS